MSRNGIFGDAIMIMAMCIALNASITVYYVKKTDTFDSITLLPMFPKDDKVDHYVNIYLDLVGTHYDCLLPNIESTTTNPGSIDTLIDVISPDVVIDSSSTAPFTKSTNPKKRKTKSTVSANSKKQKSKQSVSLESNVTPKTTKRKRKRKNVESDKKSNKKQKAKPQPKKYPIHGLVGCRSKTCLDLLRTKFYGEEWIVNEEENMKKGIKLTRYWNRDVNSTLNMLKCVYYMKEHNGSRPPYMTRPGTNHSIGAPSSSGQVSASAILERRR
jgi:hypothetical protein